MDVHQVVARAALAEPATAEALRLRRRLLEHGPSEVFSVRPPEGEIPGTRSASDPDLFADRRPDRVLIAHLSDADGLLLEFLLEFLAGGPERLVLRLQEAPDARLAPLRRRTCLAVAASRGDAERLRALGFGRVAAVPPALSREELARRAHGSGLPLPSRRDGALIGCVDPLLPEHRCEVVVQAFHILKTYRRTGAHLLLAGPREEPAYRAALQRYATELALPHVRLRSGLTAEQIAQAFGRADVLLCLSPSPSPLALLRALAFGVPVIGLRSEGAAELLDGVGLLLDRPDPVLVAEATALVLADDGVAARLRDAARSRLAALRPEAGTQAIAEAVRSLTA